MTPSALAWLHRSCGKWRSERRYLFSDKEGARPSIYTTNMVVKALPESNRFRITWTGVTEGAMEVELDGSVLMRSRDYIGEDAHDSDVEMVDEDTFVTTTTYNGITFREEIRLLGNDNYRLRQTFGLKADGSFALAGQYIEFRE
jgi:hypothetical protein